MGFVYVFNPTILCAEPSRESLIGAGLKRTRLQEVGYLDYRCRAGYAQQSMVVRRNYALTSAEKEVSAS